MSIDPHPTWGSFYGTTWIQVPVITDEELDRIFAFSSAVMTKILADHNRKVLEILMQSDERKD